MIRYSLFGSDITQVLSWNWHGLIVWKKSSIQKEHKLFFC